MVSLGSVEMLTDSLACAAGTPPISAKNLASASSHSGPGAQTGVATIFIYDGHPGGVGITRQGFLRFEQLVGDARRLIAECPCAEGCPSCVQSPKCGNLNEPLHKAGALELLELMLAAGS